MKVCGNCNNVNPDEAQFCAFCGGNLSAMVISQPMQSPNLSQPNQMQNTQTLYAHPLTAPQDYSSPAAGAYSQPFTQGYAQQPAASYSQQTATGYSQPTTTDYSQPASTNSGQPYAQNYSQQATPNYSQPHVQSYGQHAAPNYSQAVSTTPNHGYATPNTTDKKKSKTVAGVLALFLGNLGIHRFYLGNTTAGIINVVLWILIIPIPVLAVIALIEGIKFLTMSQETFEQEYLIGHKAWL
ncbi:MAG: NINE protein [Eggerthellaceae bacterium]|nr:NINE protein [Eggerthellaceae bacterium]